MLSKIVLSIYEITLFSNPFWHSLQIEPKKKIIYKNFSDHPFSRRLSKHTQKLRELPTSVVCASRFFPFTTTSQFIQILCMYGYEKKRKKNWLMLVWAFALSNNKDDSDDDNDGWKIFHFIAREFSSVLSGTLKV